MPKIEIEIPEYNDQKSARAAVRAIADAMEGQLLGEIAGIADEYNFEAHIGDYGNGQTYYPAGTDVAENYLEHIADSNGVEVDENGWTTEGMWVSSSEMC